MIKDTLGIRTRKTNFHQVFPQNETQQRDRFLDPKKHTKRKYIILCIKSTRIDR